MFTLGGILLDEYSIFWIKKEFAYHYSHKSDILFRFIRSYQENEKRQDLSGQYNYITNHFPRRKLIHHVTQFCDRRDKIKIHDHQLEISNNHRYLALHIYEKQLTFYCDSLDTAEDLLFPILRSFHPFLFIIGNNLENYGWISPITKRRQFNNRQVLYSYP